MLIVITGFIFGKASFAGNEISRENGITLTEAIASKELEKVAQQNVKTLEEHLTKAKALQQSGMETSFDVLRVEVQLNKAQSDKLNGKAQESVRLSTQ